MLVAIFNASPVLQIETVPAQIKRQCDAIHDAALLLSRGTLPAAVWRRWAAAVGDDAVHDLVRMQYHMRLLAKAARDAGEALTVPANRPKDATMLQFISRLATAWRDIYGEWPTASSGPFPELCKEIAEPLGINWPAAPYRRLRAAIDHARALR